MNKSGYVYIITNTHHTVLYTGVTSNLKERVLQHQNNFFKKSFTAKYNCTKIVWFEEFGRITDAITREKQIKGGSRKGKEDLINSFNPLWNDLWVEVLQYW